MMYYALDGRNLSRHGHLWLLSLHFNFPDDDTTDNWHGNELLLGRFFQFTLLYRYYVGFMWSLETARQQRGSNE